MKNQHEMGQGQQTQEQTVLVEPDWSTCQTSEGSPDCWPHPSGAVSISAASPGQSVQHCDTEPPGSVQWLWKFYPFWWSRERVSVLDGEV